MFGLFFNFEEILAQVRRLKILMLTNSETFVQI